MLGFRRSPALLPPGSLPGQLLCRIRQTHGRIAKRKIGWAGPVSCGTLASWQNQLLAPRLRQTGQPLQDPAAATDARPVSPWPRSKHPQAVCLPGLGQRVPPLNWQQFPVDAPPQHGQRCRCACPAACNEVMELSETLDSGSSCRRQRSTTNNRARPRPRPRPRERPETCALGAVSVTAS